MVEVLLITHGDIANSMHKVAQGIMPEKAMLVHTIPWNLGNNDQKNYATQIKAFIDTIDQGDGVLVLTDICGASPYNLVKDLTDLENHKVKLVCGLNLPMLLRVLNYIDKSLDELAEIACDGGHRGIIVE